MNDPSSRLREIPQVSALLEHPRLAVLLEGRRRSWLQRVIQDALSDLRRELLEDGGTVRKRDALVDQVVARVEDSYRELTNPAWTRVLNGTGVVVHTNLGRANLAPDAVAAMAAVAGHNTDLEYDLAAGARGHRGRQVEAKAALLAGAEDALVINNNAAAVWLAVRFTAGGGRVVISRGEIVAIGGSFRMNEILAEAGCELVEVGTTNRTSLADYAAELDVPGTAVIKVHRSNFSVEGFTEDVSLADLAQLCSERGRPLVYDAGSGALFPMAELGLPAGELTLDQDVACGPDLVTCSGDKLLGGCQAGIILGRADLIAGLRKHPMRRAFRVDKTTLAALDAVLSAYLRAVDRPPVPTLEQLGADLESLQDRAEKLLAGLAPLAPAGWRGEVVPGVSSVGGGSFSTAAIESRLVLWQAEKTDLEDVHRRLRTGDPALVGRMNNDGLAVDVRTLGDDELPLVIAAFSAAWTQAARSA
ncbi:MAG: L-seryl-tRNA(Sec) selenium transferase [bacterium]|nr:L-seryl-tRNA(Sec) selenium transferase [bacterium]